MAAGRKPDAVKGLVLLGPVARNTMGSFGTYLVTAMVSRPWGPTAWSYFSKGLWPGLGEQKSAERVDECMKALTRPKRWSAFQETVKGADHRVVEPYLGKVKKMPALVVMGEKDPDFTKPADEANWVASNFEDSTVVMVPDVGHAPHYERAEITGQAVLAFVEKLGVKGAA
jgi:pimeloyl-ACP methyl ester carboxylesterase